MIGFWQTLILLILILSVFVFPMFLVLYKREEPSHEIPWWAKIILIVSSLTWIGLLTSSYIIFRKKEYENDKMYKFSKPTRYYGIFLFVLSVLSSLFWLLIGYYGGNQG
ncbi:hypothetical protein [Aquimarina addita]|uniref:hypothetical protein n=1 Tax=Aquimarina addita TaxID=870485 RepID=UPI0031E7E70B